MRLNFGQTLNRLETLSLRERIMVVVGVPLLLAVAAEFLVSEPAIKRAAQDLKTVQLQEAELKAMNAALAAQPKVAPLPAADQLLGQRNALQGQIDAASAVIASVSQTVDWGTVVRATVAGTPGLTLTQLRTLPAELVYAPSMTKPAATPAAPGAAAARADAKPTAPPAAAGLQPAAPGESIYRHRAELTVKGNFGSLLGYLQTLQRVPGDLRWDRLQLSVLAYPQASVQLTLHTLSNRAETPFN